MDQYMRLKKKPFHVVSLTQLTLKKNAYTFPRIPEGYRKNTGRIPEENKTRVKVCVIVMLRSR